MADNGVVAGGRLTVKAIFEASGDSISAATATSRHHPNIPLSATLQPGITHHVYQLTALLARRQPDASGMGHTRPGCPRAQLVRGGITTPGSRHRNRPQRGFVFHPRSRQEQANDENAALQGSPRQRGRMRVAGPAASRRRGQRTRECAVTDIRNGSPASNARVLNNSGGVPDGHASLPGEVSPSRLAASRPLARANESFALSVVTWPRWASM
jgi:hypothetical protein